MKGQPRANSSQPSTNGSIKQLPAAEFQLRFNHAGRNSPARARTHRRSASDLREMAGKARKLLLPRTVIFLERCGHSPAFRPPDRATWRGSIAVALVALAFIGVALTASAQESEAPAETSAPAPAAPAQAAPAPASAEPAQPAVPNPPYQPADTVDPETTITADTPAGTMEAVGPVSEQSTLDAKYKFTFELLLRATYDDNLFISHRDQVQDWIFTLAPTLGVAFGDYRERQENFVALSYTAAGFKYLDNSELDKVDHQAQLEFRYRMKKTTIDFSFEYKTLSTSDIDVGTRTDRQIFRADASIEYQLSGKTSLVFDAFSTRVDYDEALDSDEGFVDLLVNYLLTPKLRVGFGFGAGILKQEGGGEQTYEQLLMRTRYLASDKVTFRMQLGAEYREFGGRDDLSPVGSLGIQYEPFDGTQLSLDAGRRILASASQVGRNYAATSVEAKIRQRLLQKFYVSLAGGYTNADYDSVSLRSGSNRKDNVFYVRPMFEYPLQKYVKIGVYYQFRKNDSTRESISFENNQVGFELTGQF